jgi:hypothetical protein
MLLAASTALSKDWDSYVRLRRYMMAAGAVLTGLHILVAFTPLYYVIVRDLIGAPVEILEPVHTGLRIFLPWTWSIAYRRFNQGVLIRFGRSGAVGTGTIVRLSANVIVLAIGYMTHRIPGIVVGTCAVAAGVMSEALFAGLVVRPVLRGALRQAPQVDHPMTLWTFLEFYFPLAMMQLLFLLAQPFGSAAISRMPMALQSLAVWPVVSGLVFLFRSLGIAYNEVVVALLDEPGSSTNLRRFSTWLAGIMTLALLVLAATPLSRFWLQTLSALPPELATLGQRGIWLALPQPALAVYQSWYQGAILHGKQTRGISEAVVVYLASMAILLIVSVIWGRFVGLNAVLTAISISLALQTVWLWIRSRPVRQAVAMRDGSMARSGVNPQIRATNTPG